MLFGRKKRRIERLLIVEDEPLVAFDTEHLLTGHGFAIVATVDSVATAVKAIGAGGIDLVLVDIDLADGNGVEVAQAAGDRGMPVLFVTGNRLVNAQALAVGCLTKPYQPRDLLAAIDAIEAVIEGVRPRRLPENFSLFAKLD